MIIESIFPHPSEEDLDVATLGPGLKCVIHKGQFNQGDRVSLVPTKTVKKGIICHGIIVKEEDVISLSDTHIVIFENSIPDKSVLLDNPDIISILDEIEEDDKVWSEDE